MTKRSPWEASLLKKDFLCESKLHFLKSLNQFAHSRSAFFYFRLSCGVSSEALTEMAQGRGSRNSSGSSEEDEKEYSNKPDIQCLQLTDNPHSALVSQKWKPLRTDWQGSSTCRSTEKRLHVVLTFEAPKVLLVRSSFGRAGEPLLSLKRCECVWCVSCLKRALRGKRANPPWSILLLFIWYAMRSVHVASIKDQSGYLTDQLRDIWDRSAESSERSWSLQVSSKLHFLCDREPAKCWQNGSSMHIY